MTLVPEKPRSEFVIPANPAGEGVCEILRMFQIASPASCSPAFSPTRGSGEGAAMSGADISGMRAIAGLADIEIDDDAPAQPAATAATASDAAMKPLTMNREDADRGRGVFDMSVFRVARNERGLEQSSGALPVQRRFGLCRRQRLEHLFHAIDL